MSSTFDCFKAINQPKLKITIASSMFFPCRSFVLVEVFFHRFLWQLLLVVSVQILRIVSSLISACNIVFCYNFG
jgi:hypothetical protein